MLLTPHVLSGMLLGGFAGDYRLSPLFGLLSFVVLELIPHWDPENFDRASVRVIRYIDFGLAFTSLFMVLVLLPYANKDTDIAMFDPRFVLGGIFASLPYLWLYYLTLTGSKNKLYIAFHNRRHWFKNTDRSFWGIMIQVSICIIAVTIMFNLIDFPSWNRLREQFFGV